MHEVSLNIKPIYWRKSDVDSATKKKHLKVLRKVWICHRWSILQILEMHYIVDPVNTCKYRRQTQYGESFCTRNGQYITWSLALFDRIKSELTIDKKKISTYIPRLKKIPGWQNIFQYSRIYMCYHGNTGDNVDHRGGYTDSSGLFKENVWILEKNNVWTEKTRTWLQQ